MKSKILKTLEILFVNILVIGSIFLITYLFYWRPKNEKLKKSNCYTQTISIEITNNEGYYYWYYYIVNNIKYKERRPIKYPEKIIGRNFKVHYVCEEPDISEILLGQPCDTLPPPE